MKNSMFMVIIGIIFVVVFVAIVVFFNSRENDAIPPVVVGTSSPKDIIYRVDGTEVMLIGGKAVQSGAAGSVSQNIFRLFGEPTYGDLDGDGDDDAVMYLTHESGGSGIFYYVIVAIREGGAYRGTNAMLLGDRIAPQNIIIQDRNAVANFAVRKEGESFAVAPSVGKSVWVHLDPLKKEIGELVKDFEGESNPAMMTLEMKKWVWISTSFANGTRVIPKTAGVFTVNFERDRSFSVSTDCNSLGGSYVMNGNVLTFEKMVSTLMFCEGSQETEFTAMLSDVGTYRLTTSGELILRLKNKDAELLFR